MTDALLGIDLGQTRVKAIVVDLDGRELGLAIDPTEASHPHPFWAERELEGSWQRVASTVRTALEAAGPAVTLLGVGVSGHSDGVYLVRENGVGVRPGILATDARAKGRAAELAGGARADRLLELTGQLPMAASPNAVIGWLLEHEPDALAGSRWILSSTDWLRLRLTGVAVTDPTMAAAAFGSLESGAWSHEVLALTGLDEVRAQLPPVVASDSVMGHVTDGASRLTGIARGTPVVAGAHDVDTGALGLGAVTTGSASILLGTYAINQVLGDRPLVGQDWQTRPFLRPGHWLHMATSPAGAGCLDWAAARIGPRDAAGVPDPAAAVAEAEVVVPTGQPYFLPFVHGGPPGSPVGGSWLGLRSEHGRQSMLYAVMEGAVFSHRSHMQALRTCRSILSPVRVGGGGARSASWTQMLADSLGSAIEVTEASEVSALGAAMLAGIGVGAYGSVEDVVAATVRVARGQEPGSARQVELDQRYERYREAVRTLEHLDLGPLS
jgi:L-xylulokinase